MRLLVASGSARDAAHRTESPGHGHRVMGQCDATRAKTAPIGEQRIGSMAHLRAIYPPGVGLLCSIP